MGFGIHTRCPVSNDALFMCNEDEESVALYRGLAQRYQLSILDICKMLGLILHGPDDVALASPEHKIEGRIRDAERDAYLLKIALPIEEALAIWVRAREGLQWLADNCPDEAQRVKIEAFLAERDKAMVALRAKVKGRRV